MRGSMRRIATALERALEWITIALMLSLTILVVVAVVYRKMGASFSWYDEVAAIQLSWITYYGAALAALKRKHIGFDGLLLRLSPPMRAAAALLSEGLVLGFFALMTWAGMRVLAVLEGDTLVSLTWVPVQFTQSVIPIGGALFIVSSLLSFPQYFRNVMAGRSMEHAELDHADMPADTAAHVAKER